MTLSRASVRARVRAGVRGRVCHRVRHKLRKMLPAAVLLAQVPVLAGAEHPLPDPDLSRLEPAVRAKLGDARQALLDSIDDPDIDAQKRSRLYGHTGKLFHAHDAYAVAEVCYRNAAALDAGELRWPYTLGFLYQDTGRFEEAKEQYRRVLELEPAHAFAQLRLAQVHLDLGEWDDAALFYERVERVLDQPDLGAAAHAGLGRIALARGDQAAAVEHYEAALELQPEARRLHVPLGQAYRGLGNMELARKHLEQASNVKLRVFDPILDDVGSLSVSSAMFLTAGAQALKAERFDKAERAFRGAIAVHPENHRAHLNLAVVLTQRGALEEAEVSAREALRLRPDYYFAYFNLGTIYEARGQLGEASGYYRRALEGNPDEVKFNYRLGGLLMRTEEYAAAAERLRVVVELAPAFVQARYLEALAHIALGSAATARDLLEGALEINPEQLTLMSPLARLLATSKPIATGDARRALVLARALIERQNSLDDGETLAMALAAAERFEEAALIQLQVIEAARHQDLEELLQHLEYNLERYRSNRPSDRPWPDGGSAVEGSGEEVEEYRDRGDPKL